MDNNNAISFNFQCKEEKGWTKLTANLVENDPVPNSHVELVEILFSPVSSSLLLSTSS